MRDTFFSAKRAAAFAGRPFFQRILLFAGLFIFCQNIQAQDFGLYWKYKDYDDVVAVSVPGWVAQLGSLFIDEKENRKLVRKIHKVRVLVFKDRSPISMKDFKRFNRKAKRRHLDELVTVRDGNTRVQVYGKSRGSTIKKLVVFFNSPDDGAGMVSLRGRFNLNEISKAFNQVGKKSKDGSKPIVPPVVKIPVSKA